MTGAVDTLLSGPSPRLAASTAILVAVALWDTRAGLRLQHGENAVPTRSP